MMDRRFFSFALVVTSIGCGDTDYYSGSFASPAFTAVAMQSNDQHSMPFKEPVGFVANRKGGKISVLALEDGRFLTNDPYASFLRGNPLATGQKRILSSIATWTSATQITLFAGDQAYKTLLEIPYITDTLDGRPVEASVTVTDPVFNDGNVTEQGPQISSLMPQTGFTGTEDWDVTFDGEYWWITGTRSGRLELPAKSGELYEDAQGALSFELTGEASKGDHFTFSSDSGIIEHDLGGIPLHLSMNPAGTLMAVVVEDIEAGTRAFKWWDPSTQTAIDIALPSDSRPGRMAWSEDGQRLYLSDSGRSSYWHVESGTVNTLPTEVLLPWPTLDIAALDGGDNPTLYVVPESNRSVWQVDALTSTLVDLNPETPELDGMDMGTFVRGIEAIPTVYPFQETEDEEPPQGRSVAVALYSGPVVFLDEETGCLIQDTLGPRTIPNTEFGLNFDYGTNFQEAAGPFLQPNSANNRHIIVNTCVGIAKTEFWTVTYDENQQGWYVEGSTSGIQPYLAHEDTRFVTPDGAISFVVRSGATPSQDGQTFRFSIDMGALKANGDNDRDGQIADGEFNLTMPSDPVFFSYQLTSTEESVDHPMLLTASEAANFVTRINPTGATLDIIWQ